MSESYGSTVFVVFYLSHRNSLTEVWVAMWLIYGGRSESFLSTCPLQFWTCVMCSALPTVVKQGGGSDVNVSSACCAYDA